MDTYEATKIVMSRIQNLDPENASKIMGYILIQDQGDKEMIRLAFSPEALLLSYINQAKTALGLLVVQKNSPRILVPSNKNGFHLTTGNSSSNPSPTSNSGSNPFGSRSSPRPICYPPPSVLEIPNVVPPCRNVGLSSPRLNFYGGNGTSINDFGDEVAYFDDNLGGGGGGGGDPIMSPSGRSDSLVFPYGEDSVPSPNSYHAFHHRRSCSVNDASGFLGGNGSTSLDDGFGGGFGGWRPCMYFARGFCKNGGNCKFVHSDSFGSSSSENVGVGDVGSPSSGFDDLLRIKALQQQRFALMAAAAAAGSGGGNPFGYNKCLDFLNENQRNEFSSSRQIYLTFPAESTFKEEDVSGYFGMFGPVQDVRIPYQQKRMFGFVTFVYPETVKLILAKGNPHFVCDSRVLVKPYKEKGKVRDKKPQHQQMERGDYQACLSPSGLDSRDHFDLPFGSRMLLSPQEMMLRRKLEEEAELQHAIELQGRRMMNLQLMDLKNQNLNNSHHFLQNFPMSSPSRSRFLMSQNFPADAVNQDDSEVFDGAHEAAKSPPDGNLEMEGTQSLNNDTTNGDDVKSGGVADLPGSPEQNCLPDNLFASPTKSVGENKSAPAQASADNTSASVKITSSNDNPETANSSPLTMASLKSCSFQIPRFSSGQEVIEM